MRPLPGAEAFQERMRALADAALYFFEGMLGATELAENLIGVGGDVLGGVEKRPVEIKNQKAVHDGSKGGAFSTRRARRIVRKNAP